MLEVIIGVVSAFLGFAVGVIVCFFRNEGDE